MGASIQLTGLRESRSAGNLAYVCQMLAELRQVASGEGADMLCYLIEMAYVEAGDIQSGRRPRSLARREGDHPAGMAT